MQLQTIEFTKCSLLKSMDDIELISPGELGNVGETEIKLKSNGVCHVEDVNDKLLEDIKIGATIAISPSETVMSPEGMGSSSPSVTKRHGMRKWRRIPREFVKNSGSNIDGRNNGDLSDLMGRNSVVNVNGDYELGDQSVVATRADSENSEDQNSRSSYAASAPRTRAKVSSSNGGNSAISVHSGDQKSNGQTGNGKKARAFKIEKENSDTNIGNFVFVQGNNSVASKSRQSGNSAKCDEEYSDDAQYADRVLNIEAESEDVAQEDAAGKDSCEVKEEKIEKHEGGFDQDALVESITRFDSAIEELQREMEKWKDIGKDEPLTFDDSIHDMLELKDAMITELESTITAGNTKTYLDDLLKEKIQAEVEIVALTTTTKNLISGPLHEMNLNIQPNNMQAEKLETNEDANKLQNKELKKQETEDVKKLQNKVLKKQETEEDLKKLQSRLCRLSSCLLIQLILLFVTFYLEIPSHKVELVPT